MTASSRWKRDNEQNGNRKRKKLGNHKGSRSSSVKLVTKESTKSRVRSSEHSRSGRTSTGDAPRHKHGRKRGNYSPSDLSDELFAAQLEPLGLRVFDIVADGNCLFRSLSFQLFGTQDRHSEIRSDIVDYIEGNENDFLPFVEDDESFEDYCDRMRESSEWGGHQELLAASRIYNIVIVIHQLDQPRFELGEAPQDRVVNLGLDGDHYSALRPVTDASSGPVRLGRNRKVGNFANREALEVEEHNIRRIVVAANGALQLPEDRENILLLLNDCQGDVDACVEYVETLYPKGDRLTEAVAMKRAESQDTSASKASRKKLSREQKAAKKAERERIRAAKRAARMNGSEAEEDDVNNNIVDLGVLKL